jgi:hypothetical protein
MKTTLLISAIAFTLAYIGWDTRPTEPIKHEIVCTICATKIDTVGDKAMLQVQEDRIQKF